MAEWGFWWSLWIYWALDCISALELIFPFTSLWQKPLSPLPFSTSMNRALALISTKSLQSETWTNPWPFFSYPLNLLTFNLISFFSTCLLLCHSSWSQSPSFLSRNHGSWSFGFELRFYNLLPVQPRVELTSLCSSVIWKVGMVIRTCLAYYQYAIAVRRREANERLTFPSLHYYSE